MLAISGILLAAVYGYQAFGIPGLTLTAAALLLVLLMALLNRPAAPALGDEELRRIQPCRDRRKD